MKEPLSVQIKRERIQFQALRQHSSRVVNEMQRQFLLWEDADYPDGVGEEYAQKARHYKQIAGIKAKAGELTWADIFLEEVFELMETTNPEDFDEEAAEVEGVLRSWLKARASRSLASV
jgi:hypothetical protein